MKRFVLLFLIAARAVLAAPDDSPSGYYTVETIKTPPGLSAEVGGLAFMPDGRLVACFHRGEVYTYDPAKQEWKLFAQGLHDPLGVLAPKNDEVVVMQRPELTRLRDTDGDGVADHYETICDAFGMSGNYHEFAFGPVAAPDGGWFVALNTASEGAGIRHEVRGELRERGTKGRMYAAVPWRGWIAKISPDGKFTPWASGFRSPNTPGFDAQGRLFVPDNQGDWIGTSPLYHVEKGKFYGHPAALAWQPGETRAPLEIPVDELDMKSTRPAILFPDNIMANSPTQPFPDTTGGKFGPFAGQLLVGEMNRARIMRVVFDEVDGQLQGMAVPLLDDHGLRRGDNRFAFAPDGSLWAGQTDHGWAGDKGLQRISWTGKVPLDVKEMRLTASGFEMTFTRPLAAASVNRPEAFKVQRYYYEYHAAYGSKQFDLAEAVPQSVTLSDDRLTVTLDFDPLVAWRIYQFNLAGLKAEDGAALANPLVIYTLNRLLSGTPPPPPPGPGAVEEAEGGKTKDAAKPSPVPPPAPAVADKKAKATPTPAPKATPKKPAGKAKPVTTIQPAAKATPRPKR